MVGISPPLNPKFINHMSKEGSTEAPIRHPINFEHPDFFRSKKIR